MVEAIRVDASVSEDTITMGGDLFLRCIQQRTQILNQGLMLSYSVHFSAHIASGTLSFGQRKKIALSFPDVDHNQLYSHPCYDRKGDILL